MEPIVAAADALARVALQGALNGMWKGVLLVCGVAVLLRLLPHGRAATRHHVWAATLLLLVVLPFSEAWTASRASVVSPPQPAGRGHSAPGAEHPAARWSVPAPPRGWPALLLGATAALAALRVARLARGARELRRLKRAAHPLRPGAAERLRPLIGRYRGRAVELSETEELTTPVAVGYLHPAILLPSGLLDELAPEDLERVALHELAHLLRRDDWVNLAQRLAEAVLFAQPPLLWVGRRIELEREIACDEFVLSVLADGRGYARCLVRLAEVAAAARQRPLAPGAAPAASQLARRVQALLGVGPVERPRIARVAGALAVPAAAGIAALLHVMPGVEVARVPVSTGAGAPGRLPGAAVEPAATPPPSERLAPLAVASGPGRPDGAPRVAAVADAERPRGNGEAVPRVPEPEVQLACAEGGCTSSRAPSAEIRQAVTRRQVAGAATGGAAIVPRAGERALLRVRLTLALPARGQGSAGGRPAAITPPPPGISGRPAAPGVPGLRVIGGGAGWRPDFHW